MGSEAIQAFLWSGLLARIAEKRSVRHRIDDVFCSIGGAIVEVRRRIHVRNRAVNFRDRRAITVAEASFERIEAATLLVAPGVEAPRREFVDAVGGRGVRASTVLARENRAALNALSRRQALHEE